MLTSMLTFLQQFKYQLKYKYLHNFTKAHRVSRQQLGIMRSKLLSN